MPDEKIEEKKAEERDDANNGTQLDKVLAHLDSLHKRLDSLEGKSKKDGEEEEPEDVELKEEKGEPEKMAADKAKKDGEEEKPAEEALKKEREDKAKKDGEESEEEKMADKSKKDAEEIKRAVADEFSKHMPKERGDEEAEEMVDAQSKADSVMSAFGKRAAPPLRGETPRAYRIRLASQLKQHSFAWKGVDLGKLPADALGIAEAAIYADSMAAARNPTDIPAHTLREIVTTDRAGRRISTFVGDADAWMSQFKSPSRRLVGINKEG